MRRYFFSLFSILMSITIIAAQSLGECSEIVTHALETAGDACEGIGRNEVCYGFNLVDAKDFDLEAVDDFSETGDIVPIEEIGSLLTAPYNADDETWGIAVLSVQANLPDTLPGQNVTILLFGDTEISADENPNTETLNLTATATSNANLRSGAGTNYVVVGSLAVNEAVNAVGRNAAGDWVLIEREDGSSAWVFAELLSLEGDIDALAVRSSGKTAPMQAFHISTGIGTTTCEDVPQDGLLIQAPENTEVNFLINGIEVVIGSTALIRSNEERMTVSTFAGEVILASEGQSEIIMPGLQSSVKTGEAPTEAKPYTTNEVRHVPVDLLPDVVNIPPPAGQEINITQCYFGSGSITVDSNSPIIIRTGWASRTMPELQEFMDAVTLNLSYDGEVQEAWSHSGAIHDPNRGDYPFINYWFWVVDNLEIGTHDMRVDYHFSRPIDIDGVANVQEFESITCQLIVQ